MGTVEKLKGLGFTTNEAKAYLALLGCQPASAYEIAKQAGLPSSKIYETVSRLTSKGIFQSTDNPGGQQYLAMEPVDLMTSIKNSAIRETEALLPELARIPDKSRSNLIWTLLGHQQIRNRSLELINEAQSTILVSLWPEELAWCREALKEAENRGVRIALVHFGIPRTTIGATYHHPVEKTLYAEKGGRGFTLVADATRVVIANFCADQEAEGAWSANQPFVTVAEDYIKHDVYITKVTRFLGPEVVRRFGEDYARLRDVFSADA